MEGWAVWANFHVLGDIPREPLLYG